ncbi:unnamed protein product [Scytosiphon promiscuus]
MRGRKMRPGIASMAQSTGMLMLGLLRSSFVRVNARVNPRGTLAGPFTSNRLNGPPSITHFEASGATEIMRSFIRMTSDGVGTMGALWSISPLRSNGLSLEWEFRIGGEGNDNFCDFFSLTISPNAPNSQQFHGEPDENFVGLSVVVDTERRRSLLDEISGDLAALDRDVTVIAGNGTRSYEDVVANLEGCTADIMPSERNDDHGLPRSSRIRLKVYDNKVAVDVDAGNTGMWRQCVADVPVDMPPDWAYMSHVGVMGRTSGVSIYQDLVRLQVYTKPDEAWNTDIYSEDRVELDATKQYAHHSGGIRRGNAHHHGGIRRGEPDAWYSDVDAIEGYSRNSMIKDLVGLVFIQRELVLLVGLLSLALIAVLSVTRAVERSQLTNRHRGPSGGDAPSGYQALPEDDAAALATQCQSRPQREVATSDLADDAHVNDEIVVTGTAENMSPPAHL